MTDVNDLADALDSRRDWLAELPAYQRDLIEQLRVGRSLEETAQAWLEASPAQTVGFGVISTGKIFFDKVLDEIHHLLCDSTRYTEERASLLKEYKAGQSTVVATMTGVIAPVVGTSSALLAPVIAIALTIIGQASLRAWCELHAERKSGDAGSTKPTR